VYKLFREPIGRAWRDVVFLESNTSSEEAKRDGNESRDALPVVFALTGSTSRLIYESTKSSGHHRVVIIGHGEHNSLASAMSARARLDADGVWRWVFHCGEPSSTECAVTSESYKSNGSRLEATGL
jgi:L-fucose isomerase-like protein